jgi:hypothetical protein
MYEFSWFFFPMKSLTLPLTVLALAGSSAAYAITPGSSATLTLALTASIESPGIKITDPETKEVTYEYEKTTAKEDSDGNIVSETNEYKSVLTTLRYGNAQVLADLNQQGLLDGTISAWRIVAVCVASDFGSANDRGAVPYAVKKGRAPVQLEFTSATIATAELLAGKVT